jgi:hypothetical protein
MKHLGHAYGGFVPAISERGMTLSDEWKWMLSVVNAIAYLLYIVFTLCLHHILLDDYDYLMMQSCLWQMVRTRATKDDMLDIPEGSTPRGRGRGQPSRGNAPPPPPHPLVSLEQLLAT